MEHYAEIDVSLELSSVCVVGEIALGLAMLERAKRASHIESASVTLRHHAEGVPYRGENHGPGMMRESLTTTLGIRERPRPGADLTHLRTRKSRRRNLKSSLRSAFAMWR